MAYFARSASGFVIEVKSPLAWRFAAAIRVMHNEIQGRNKNVSMRQMGRDLGAPSIASLICASWMPSPSSMKEKGWLKYFRVNAPKTFPLFKPLFEAHIHGRPFPALSAQEVAAMPLNIRDSYNGAAKAANEPMLADTALPSALAETPSPSPQERTPEPEQTQPAESKASAATTPILLALPPAPVRLITPKPSHEIPTLPPIPLPGTESAPVEKTESARPTNLGHPPRRPSFPTAGTPEAVAIGKEIRAITEHHGLGVSDRPELAYRLGIAVGSATNVLSGIFMPSIDRQKGLTFWLKLQSEFADGFKKHAKTLKPLMADLHAYLAWQKQAGSLLEAAKEKQKQKEEKRRQPPPAPQERPAASFSAAKQETTVTAKPQAEPVSVGSAAPVEPVLPEKGTISARRLGQEIYEALTHHGYSKANRDAFAEILGLNATALLMVLSGRAVYATHRGKGRYFWKSLHKNFMEGIDRCAPNLKHLVVAINAFIKWQEAHPDQNAKKTRRPFSPAALPKPVAAADPASFRQAAARSTTATDLMNGKPAPRSPLAREIAAAFRNIFDHHGRHYTQLWKWPFNLKNEHVLRRILEAEDIPTPKQMNDVYLPVFKKSFVRGLEKFGGVLQAYAKGEIAFTPVEKKPAAPRIASSAKKESRSAPLRQAVPSLPPRWFILDHYPKEVAEKVLANIRAFLNPARYSFQQTAYALNTSVTRVKNLWLKDLSHIPSPEEMIEQDWPNKLQALDPDAMDNCFALKNYWADALHAARAKTAASKPAMLDIRTTAPLSEKTPSPTSARPRIKSALLPFHQRASNFVRELASGIEDCGIVLSEAFGADVWNGLSGGDGAAIPPATYCEMIERVCRMASIRTNQPATTEGKIARFLLDEGQEIATKSGSPVSAPAPR